MSGVDRNRFGRVTAGGAGVEALIERDCAADLLPSLNSIAAGFAHGRATTSTIAFAAFVPITIA